MSRTNNLGGNKDYHGDVPPSNQGYAQTGSYANGNQQSLQQANTVTPTVVQAQPVLYSNGPNQMGGPQGVMYNNGQQGPAAVAQPYHPYSNQQGHIVVGGHPGMYNNGMSGRATYVARDGNMEYRIQVGGNANAPFDLSTLTPRQGDLLEIYKIARFIRMISIIDLIFVIISALFSPWTAFLIPLPICGYYGAKGYNNTLIYLYVFYLIVRVVLSIVLIIAVNNPGFTVITVLYMILCTMIMRYAIILTQFIKTLTDDDLQFLTTSEAILYAEQGTC